MNGFSGPPHGQLIRETALPVSLGQGLTYWTAQVPPGNLPGVVRSLAVNGKAGLRPAGLKVTVNQGKFLGHGLPGRVSIFQVPHQIDQLFDLFQSLAIAYKHTAIEIFKPLGKKRIFQLVHRRIPHS